MSIVGRGATFRVRRARGGGCERLRASDLELLGWLTEQYGAPATQLELLLGRGERTVQRTVARLRAAGLVQLVRLLVGEAAWVIPTTAGIRAAGYSFPAWRPRVALLGHVAAVNAVRLHIQRSSGETEWVSERLLIAERAPGEHLPDGVAIAGGERIAIEVELTVKSMRRIHAILDELSQRYDAIAYFCAPGPLRQLTALESSQRWPSLTVRSTPADARSPRS